MNNSHEWVKGHDLHFERSDRISLSIKNTPERTVIVINYHFAMNKCITVKLGRDVVIIVNIFTINLSFGT